MTLTKPDAASQIFESLNLADFPEDSRYKFLTASVVPRPIALVTSCGDNGVLNAAPFSQFVIVSVSPPLLAIVSHDAPGGYKDTVRNILHSKEYVINSVSESMAAQVQECSVAYGPEVSEVAVTGLTTLASSLVKPARIAESPIQFECRLTHSIPFGNEGSKTMMLVGEVVQVHCREGLLTGHRIEHAKFQPLGRIAGRKYTTTRDVLDV